MVKTNSTLLKVGIQGGKASFHDSAADLYLTQYFAKNSLSNFGSNSNNEFFTYETVEFDTFRRLCEALDKEQLDLAIMAIENSIAGSILPNYHLIESFQFTILGEVYLRIIMNLMALPGQKIEDLQFVQSHPMALLQCLDFLARYPFLKAVEALDTADSAKFIKENKLKNYGAIASQKAAARYGLDLLAESIETNKQNFTRFLVLCKKPLEKSPHFNFQQVLGVPDKSSLRFELPHHPGALSAVLLRFAQSKINMTKIQSLPILGKPYEYSFHVDVEWENKREYEQCLRDLIPLTQNLLILGEYPKGQKY